MDALIDNIARALATGHSRRTLLKLLGGAFASVVVGAFATEPLSATTCTPDQIKYGAKPCGASNNKEGACCPAGTCCAIGGQGPDGPHVVNCCHSGECYCANGRCAASKGSNSCPGGCTLCTA